MLQQDCGRNYNNRSQNISNQVRTLTNKCPPYRGTNVSRYTPTSQRPIRYFDKRYTTWWPRNYTSVQCDTNAKLRDDEKSEQDCRPSSSVVNTVNEDNDKSNESVNEQNDSKLDECSKVTQEILQDESEKTQSDQRGEPGNKDALNETSDIGLIKKRLYSTVLSTQPVNVANVRQTKKSVIPGLIKLNPKIVLPTIRLTNVDSFSNSSNKFEELEKEALEQYKASDESIDTKLNELEKQAVEQYSTSNSNTSCSSSNSAGKKVINTKPVQNQNNKKQTRFRKDKINTTPKSQRNDFNKTQTSSVMNLKNFQTPLRGEKKEQMHRSHKCQQNIKNKCQRAGSDTDYEYKEYKSNKGKRWMLRVISPKKRHLKICVSDTSDDELKDIRGSMKGVKSKNKSESKVKIFTHGCGDLNPVLRKST